MRMCSRGAYSAQPGQWRSISGLHAHTDAASAVAGGGGDWHAIAPWARCTGFAARLGTLPGAISKVCQPRPAVVTRGRRDLLECRAARRLCAGGSAARRDGERLVKIWPRPGRRWPARGTGRRGSGAASEPGRASVNSRALSRNRRGHRPPPRRTRPRAAGAPVSGVTADGRGYPAEEPEDAVDRRRGGRQVADRGDLLRPAPPEVLAVAVDVLGELLGAPVGDVQPGASPVAGEGATAYVWPSSSAASFSSSPRLPEILSSAMPGHP